MVNSGTLDGKMGHVTVDDSPDSVIDSLPEIDYVKLDDGGSWTPNIDGSDPFAKSGEELKKLRGLSSSASRRRSNQISKAFTGEDNARSKKRETEDVTGYSLFEAVTPPYNLDYLAKLNEANSVHYSAVKAKVANIVGLGYNLVENAKTKIRIEETESPDELKKLQRKITRLRAAMSDRLDSINSEDSFSEILQKVWTDYETMGNGYIEIGRIKTPIPDDPRNGRIGYIGHINAKDVRIRRARDGYVQIVGGKAVFFRNFGDRDTVDPIGGDDNPNEIIHLKKYAPSSGYYGIPDIIAAMTSVVGMEFAARFNLDYFENKAVPRHVIILKGARLGNAAERNLMEFFETGLKGKNHRSLYIPLPAGDKENPVDFKIEAVEAGVQDSSFDKYDTGNIDKILMVHRVPRTKVSASGNMNLANARDLDKTFKEQVCQPEQRILESKLAKFIREMNNVFELHLNEMTLTDADTQSKIDERDLRNDKRTPNELRARDGAKGLEDGDLTWSQKQAKIKASGVAQRAADQKATATQSRSRDSTRAANATDSAGEGRQAKGDGRASP